MTDTQRIQQFKQMAEADPDNELGHFGLGRIYLDTGRYGEAVAPLARAVELNPRMSKAYQLLGEAYDKTGERTKAIEIMTRGVTIADEQGDRMPCDAMVKTLVEWGAQVPALKDSRRADAEIATGGPSTPGFRCSRCGRGAGRLEKAPFRGALGERILSNVCSACWREWIPMGTKVINELGLVLSSTAGQQAYDQYMLEFLQIEDREAVDPCDGG